MAKIVQEIIADWLDREQRSQSYLARRAGISEWTVSRLMKQHHEPTHVTLRKLERAMGLKTGILQGIAAQQRQEASSNGKGNSQ